MVNLSVSALRKYEKEGLLLYHRTDTGRRLLSRADVERIKIIQYLISGLGLNLEGIRRLLALLPCWKLRPCTSEQKSTCAAAASPLRPCWSVMAAADDRRRVECRQCHVYRHGAYCTGVIKSLLYDSSETDSID